MPPASLTAPPLQHAPFVTAALSIVPLFNIYAPAAGAKPSPPTAAEFFLISAIAKLGATVLTYPLLVVKSRLQAANKDTHADLKYTGAIDAVTRIWKHEGEQLPWYHMKGAPVPRACDLNSTAATIWGCSAAQPLQTWQLHVEGQQVPGQDACKVLEACFPLHGSCKHQAGDITSRVVAVI